MTTSIPLGARETVGENGSPPIDRWLSPAGRTTFRRHARPFAVGPSILRQEGDRCEGVTILAAGELRVLKRRPSGREITLYTVGPGDLCALETLAVLADTRYRADAVVETPAVGLTIPAATFRELVDTEPILRSWVFASLESRLARALDLVGDVALGSLESRLAGLLLRRSRGGSEVRLTHERLARDLACAREAVSRTLGGWERAGLVRLGRGQVVLLDRERLRALATADGATTG